MRDLDLTSLRYFVAVCESGNITRAAEREHIVASAISKRLAQLEQDLGVSLLQRQRRGVAPTPAGELLLEQSRAILSAATRVAQDVASFGSGLRGHVSVLASDSCIAEALPDDVAAFMKMPEHRQIHVDIEESLSRGIVRRLKEGSASLGVLWGASDLEGLQTTPYRSDHVAAVVPPAHPLARRKACTFVDTLDFEHVGLQPAAAANVMMARAAAVAGRHISYRTQVSTFDAALRIVKAELGISLIPREIASVHANALGLKVIPLQDGWARRQFVIACRDRGSLSKAAALLLDFLAAVAQEDGEPTASRQPASRQRHQQ